VLFSVTEIALSDKSAFCFSWKWKTTFVPLVLTESGGEDAIRAIFGHPGWSSAISQSRAVSQWEAR